MPLSPSSASRHSQAGFALMEAVIASAVLMIVILGVLKGLDTANRSSGREKARAVAAALTEQDQERLRSFRAVDLSNYEETRSVEVNNVSYTIDSKAEWVRDSTGGTESCNSSTTQADYMRVVSTTSSGLVATPIAPITMASLVAAPIGAFGTNQGTLGVQVNDRDGEGVPGMPVTISGPATVTNETNSVGCAIFAYVPIGSYTARLNEAGWVDQSGATNSAKGATVTNGEVSITTMTYDRAASVQVSFDTVTARDGLVSAKHALPFLARTPLCRPDRSPRQRACGCGIPPAASRRPRSTPRGCSRSVTATACSPAAAAAPTRRTRRTTSTTTTTRTRART